MVEFLAEYIGTVLVGLAVAALVTASGVKVWRDRKKGGCAGCGIGCAACPKRGA